MNWDEPTRVERRVWEIDDGWDVIAADGEQVGQVTDVRGTHIVVELGSRRGAELQIPVKAIAAVEGRRVYLSLPRAALGQLGWDQTPTRAMRQQPRSGRPERMPGPVVTEPPGAGAVIVDQESAEPLSVDAPLRLEEIVVERRAVSPPVPAEEMAVTAPFQELDIIIPLRGEEAMMVTRPVVREQVLVRRGTRPREDAPDRAGTRPGSAARAQVRAQRDATPAAPEQGRVTAPTSGLNRAEPHWT